MATAQDIIKGAMRKLGVLASNEEPSAEDATDGLEALNDMCNAWDGQDIYTGFSTLAAVTDDFVLEERHHGAAKAMLAVYMAPNFGASVSKELAQQAYQGALALKADYRPIETLQVDTALQFMPSQGRRW